MRLPPAPVNVGPGTVIWTRNEPSPPIVPCASAEVSDPGNATNDWYPLLFLDWSSGM